MGRERSAVRRAEKHNSKARGGGESPVPLQPGLWEASCKSPDNKTFVLLDGLFGQCQAGVGQARPLLQVTSPVLQRLQGVLRQLMSQGEVWLHWNAEIGSWCGWEVKGHLTQSFLFLQINHYIHSRSPTFLDFSR